MEQEVVVKENLTESMIIAGRELTHNLDELHWPVTASIWFYLIEENQWRLLLASPFVKKEGPKKAYGHVQEAIRRLPKESPKVKLHDITVTDDSHPLVSLMRIAIPTDKEISNIRFSKSAINGHSIEDTYIYRLH